MHLCGSRSMRVELTVIMILFAVIAGVTYDLGAGGLSFACGAISMFFLGAVCLSYLNKNS